jgi:hypothetical protein
MGEIYELFVVGSVKIGEWLIAIGKVRIIRNELWHFCVTEILSANHKYGLELLSSPSRL